MALQRAILELGAGVSFDSGDYTRAAVRAVDDAIHHSSLTFLRTLEIDPAHMTVTVTIAVQEPDQVDVAAVKARVPYAQVTINVVKGGLNVPGGGGDSVTVIASAGVEVHIDVSTK